MITNPGKDGADLVKMEITRQKKRNNYPFGLDGKMTVNLSESGELTAESINQPLIDLLRKNPDITGSDFEDLAQKAKIGGGQKAVRKFLKEGVKTGHISERAGERTSKHFTWMAVDSDPQKMRKGRCAESCVNGRGTEATCGERLQAACRIPTTDGR